MSNKKVFGHLFFLLICFATIPGLSIAQEKEVVKPADSLKPVAAIIDSAAPGGKPIKKERVYSPGKAALRSAILPGWGQIYNKKYWKLPIVYGALGTTAVVFFFNLTWYNRSRFAYRVLATGDTNNFVNVHEDLQIFIENNDLNQLQYIRDQYRQDIDYSVLFFLLFWGLNVVDAAVDAHLKSFNVSPDLSLRFKPGYSEMAGTNGLSLVLNVGKRKQTTLLPSKF